LCCWKRSAVEMAWEAIARFDRWFEETFSMRFDLQEPYTTRLMATRTFLMPTVAVGLYLLMVYYLPRILKDSKPRKLRVILCIWNLFLFLLSLMMFIGVSLPFFRNVWRRGWFGVVCDPDHWMIAHVDSLVFWGYLFAWTKYLELFDTLFLIIKDPSRPVRFLHWYHHTTVLLYCWFSEYTRFNIGFIFIICNSLVHTFMYLYYFETALGLHPSWAMPLTIAQIVQMFIGIGALCTWIYLFMAGYNCSCDYPYTIIASGIIMYGSYLYLFVDFFVDRYLRKKHLPASDKTTDKNTKTTQDVTKKDQ